ncbi:hypothetical protein BOSEA31B_12988 [Hyphomicrobiales bacterium]|nr:hypothetical protein BOSEA31B_12988 [Hyphomicrobiales bacterium]CAH1698760.1 hypothetical protein BOSEA1005_11813 [Hyphomicrobiales bacterium]
MRWRPFSLCHERKPASGAPINLHSIETGSNSNRGQDRPELIKINKLKHQNTCFCSFLT